jgi:hypothetical protein
MRSFLTNIDHGSGAQVQSRCPVTHKSAVCQALRPFRHLCHLNRPGSSIDWALTCSFLGRCLCSSGRNDWQTSSSASARAALDGAPRRDFCHRRKPAQVRGGVPGRDACHGTPDSRTFTVSSREQNHAPHEPPAACCASLLRRRCDTPFEQDRNRNSLTGGDTSVNIEASDHSREQQLSDRPGRH